MCSLQTCETFQLSLTSSCYLPGWYYDNALLLCWLQHSALPQQNGSKIVFSSRFSHHRSPRFVGFDRFALATKARSETSDHKLLHGMNCAVFSWLRLCCPSPERLAVAPERFRQAVDPGLEGPTNMSRAGVRDSVPYWRGGWGGTAHSCCVCTVTVNMNRTHSSCDPFSRTGAPFSTHALRMFAPCTLFMSLTIEDEINTRLQ